MKKSAFTLVELMVAMAIIGVLLGLAVFGVSAAQRAQRNTEKKAALQDINLGIQTYIDTFGTSPATIFFDASGSAYVGGSDSNCTNSPATCVQVPLKNSAKPSVNGSVSDGGLGAATSASGAKYIFHASCTGGYDLAVCVEGSDNQFDVGTCTPQPTDLCP